MNQCGVVMAVTLLDKEVKLVERLNAGDNFNKSDLVKLAEIWKKTDESSASAFLDRLNKLTEYTMVLNRLEMTKQILVEGNKRMIHDEQLSNFFANALEPVKNDLQEIEKMKEKNRKEEEKEEQEKKQEMQNCKEKINIQNRLQSIKHSTTSQNLLSTQNNQNLQQQPQQYPNQSSNQEGVTSPQESQNSTTNTSSNPYQNPQIPNLYTTLTSETSPTPTNPKTPVQNTNTIVMPTGKTAGYRFDTSSLTEKGKVKLDDKSFSLRDSMNENKEVEDTSEKTKIIGLIEKVEQQNFDNYLQSKGYTKSDDGKFLDNEKKEIQLNQIKESYLKDGRTPDKLTEVAKKLKDSGDENFKGITLKFGIPPEKVYDIEIEKPNKNNEPTDEKTLTNN